jgi:putative ABC transport system permease protein
MLDSLVQDIRFAFRSLRRAPAFTALVVLVLAVGIGANTALFSVVNAVMIRSLPYNEPEDLVLLQESPNGKGTMPVSYPDYKDWRERQRSFVSMGFAMRAKETWVREQGSERVETAMVCGEFFGTYGVQPAAGRMIRADDNLPGAPLVAVLDYEFWKTRFGGDAGAVGRSIRLDNRSFQVVGVAQPFAYFDRPGVYYPVEHAPAMSGTRIRANHSNNAVTGRLKRGVTLERARGDMTAIAKDLEREHPGSNRGVGAVVMPLSEWIAGGARKQVYLLFGAVALVLFIACFNVANLLTARAISREREIAIREALGAGGVRIARQLLVESVMLAVAGAAAGLAIARAARSALIFLVPDAMEAALAETDWRVFAFAALAALFTGLLFGAAPAMHAMRVRFHDAIRQGARAISPGGARHVRSALVVTQVALAVILLAGAGLLSRSLHNLVSEDLGFRTAQVLSVRAKVPTPGAQVWRNVQSYEQMLEEIRALPGVESAAGVNQIPLGFENSSANLLVEGQEEADAARMPSAGYRVASPEYFATLGIPLLRGRIYTKADGQIGDLPEDRMLDVLRAQSFNVVINDAMARKFWPGKDAIGKRFRFGPPSLRGPWCTVIGVVGNSRSRRIDESPDAEYYFSAFHFPIDNQHLLMRFTGDAGQLEAQVRRIVLKVQPAAVMEKAISIEQMIERSTSSRRATLGVIGAFAGVALLLSALGIYGVIAFSVGLRRREFGVRQALGATRGIVAGLVVGQAIRLSLAGVAAGLALAVALSRYVASMLYNVKAVDPLTYSLVAGALVLIAVLAALRPAAVATRADPAESLRAD